MFHINSSANYRYTFSKFRILQSAVTRITLVVHRTVLHTIQQYLAIVRTTRILSAHGRGSIQR